MIWWQWKNPFKSYALFIFLIVYIDNNGRRATVIIISNRNYIAYQKKLPRAYFLSIIDPSTVTVFAHLNRYVIATGPTQLVTSREGKKPSKKSEMSYFPFRLQAYKFFAWQRASSISFCLGLALWDCSKHSHAPACRFPWKGIVKPTRFDLNIQDCH